MFTMTPRSAARLMPAMTATGVARIRGQGVATTSTASTLVGLPVTRYATPHIRSVTGVNHTAKRSAMRWIGGFSWRARSTSSTICWYWL
jgi:hypothetical protein